MRLWTRFSAWFSVTEGIHARLESHLNGSSTIKVRFSSSIADEFLADPRAFVQGLIVQVSVIQRLGRTTCKRNFATYISSFNSGASITTVTIHSVQ